MPKRALILGINGQDGSFVADILLARGYEVHGLYRRSSCDNLWRIEHLRGRVVLHHGDLCCPTSVGRVLATVRPNEVYNEADQDSVGWSHATPGYQFDVTARAVVDLLETIKELDKSIRIFQPCTAMMFGDAAVTDVQPPQNEETPFNPQSPYAVAKLASYYLCRHYREQHGMFVSTGILFNHDSPRRSEHYLLHKICRGVKRIDEREQETLALGNLDAVVDVGYAKDFMEAAWRMLQEDQPDDFVIGTGIGYTVLDLVRMAFEVCGTRFSPGMITRDPEFWRESPRGKLIADYSKAKRVLGWEPRTSIKDLMTMIMEAK